MGDTATDSDYHGRAAEPLRRRIDLNADTAHARRATSRTLGVAFDLIRPRLELVDRFISEQLAAGPDAVREAGRYVFDGGGKRLRPALLLVVTKLLGAGGDRDVRYGAVVEMIHTATLIHDDIIDHSQVRRGRPTANHKWGNQLTVLLGDWLYTRSLELALDVGDVHIMRVLSRATIAMIEGEIRALASSGRVEITQAEYLDIAGRKTGELFAATCSIPALFQAHTGHHVERLAAYGYNLGICFQIVDDLLDITGSQQRLGKPVFSDLREGKVTLPFILAWPHLDAATRSTVSQVVRSGGFGSTSAAELRAVLVEHGALQLSLEAAAAHGRAAVEALADLPAGLERDALAAAPGYLLEREY